MVKVAAAKLVITEMVSVGIVQTVKALVSVACCPSGLLSMTLAWPMGASFGIVMLATICVVVRTLDAFTTIAGLLKESVDVGWKFAPFRMKLVIVWP